MPDWKGGTPRNTRVLDRKVRFVGDAVALVAAATEEIAQAALKLIDVEYEVLPAVFGRKRPSNPVPRQLYEECPGNVVPPDVAFFGPEGPDTDRHGRCGRGLGKPTRSRKGTFGYENMPTRCRAEPPGAIALWEEPNRVTIWVSSQASFMDKVVLSYVMNRRVEAVRSIGGPCGGSFGSKLMSWQVQSHAALLARATGRPVKLVLTKEEHLAVFTVRPAPAYRRAWA